MDVQRTDPCRDPHRMWPSFSRYQVQQMHCCNLVCAQHVRHSCRNTAGMDLTLLDPCHLCMQHLSSLWQLIQRCITDCSVTSYVSCDGNPLSVFAWSQSAAYTAYHKQGTALPGASHVLPNISGCCKCHLPHWAQSNATCCMHNHTLYVADKLFGGNLAQLSLRFSRKRHQSATNKSNTSLIPALSCTTGLAAAPGLEGLQCAHKWLADLLVHFSKDVTAYSAVRLVSLPSFHCHL